MHNYVKSRVGDWIPFFRQHARFTFLHKKIMPAPQALRRFCSSADSMGKSVVLHPQLSPSALATFLALAHMQSRHVAPSNWSNLACTVSCWTEHHGIKFFCTNPYLSFRLSAHAVPQSRLRAPSQTNSPPSSTQPNATRRLLAPFQFPQPRTLAALPVFGSLAPLNPPTATYVLFLRSLNAPTLIHLSPTTLSSHAHARLPTAGAPPLLPRTSERHAASPSSSLPLSPKPPPVCLPYGPLSPFILPSLFGGLLLRESSLASPVPA